MLNINDFEFGKSIFRSEKCSVLAATNKLNSEEVALKCYSLNTKEGKDYRAIINEVALLSKLKHPNVVELVGYAEERVYDEAVNSDVIAFYVVLEKMDGTLKQELKTFKKLNQTPSLEKIRNFIRDIFPAAFYISKNRIAHQDLKPSNILIKNNKYKIGDMCIARNLYSTNGVGSLNTIEGTLAYFAPEKFEVFKKNEGSTDFNPLLADVFSLGVILMEMCLVKKLKNINSKEQLIIILDKLFSEIDLSFSSTSLSNLLKAMLEIDPAKRKTLGEIMKEQYFEDFISKEEMNHLERFPFLSLDYLIENFLTEAKKEEIAPKTEQSRETQTDNIIIEKKDIGVSAEYSAQSVSTDTSELNTQIFEEKSTMTELRPEEEKRNSFKKSGDFIENSSQTDEIIKNYCSVSVQAEIEKHSLSNRATDVPPQIQGYQYLKNPERDKDYFQNALSNEEASKEIENLIKEAERARKEGQYTRALEIYEKSFKLKWKTQNPEDGQLSSILYGLGHVCIELGNYSKGKELHEKSLNLRRKIYGEINKYTADSYNSMGVSYHGLGIFQKGLEYFEKALVIYEKIYGKESKNTALAYNNVGGSFSLIGNHEKALEYKMRALNIKIALYGEDHEETAWCYDNVGLEYTELGNKEKAIEFKYKALEIRKKIFGENHPQTAISYNNLAVEFGNQGENQRSLDFHKKSFEIRLRLFGEFHPETSRSYHNIGCCYYGMYDFEKAVEHFQKAYEIRSKVLGEKHPDSQRSKRELEDSKERLNEIRDNYN